MEWKWHVYIILCNDGTYYTGCTWDIANRMGQHKTGLGSKYTSRYGYKKLMYVEEHNDLGMARKRERQIKDWSQEKKGKLIKGKWGKY